MAAFSNNTAAAGPTGSHVLLLAWQRLLLAAVCASACPLTVTVVWVQDEQLMQVDGLVARLRRQQRAAEFSGSAAHALLGSPAR
jgi:hypothetical protein